MHKVARTATLDSTRPLIQKSVRAPPVRLHFNCLCPPKNTFQGTRDFMKEIYLHIISGQLWLRGAGCLFLNRPQESRIKAWPFVLHSFEKWCILSDLFNFESRSSVARILACRQWAGRDGDIEFPSHPEKHSPYALSKRVSSFLWVSRLHRGRPACSLCVNSGWQAAGRRASDRGAEQTLRLQAHRPAGRCCRTR